MENSKAGTRIIKIIFQYFVGYGEVRNSINQKNGLKESNN